MGILLLCQPIYNKKYHTTNLPNLCEYLGTEQYLTSHHFDVKYNKTNPNSVIINPTGKIDA